MIKQKTAICVLLFFQLALSACSAFTVAPDSSSTQESYQATNQCSSINENAETIEATEFYKIVHSDFMYYYFIFDENHDIVKSEGPFNRQPHISMVNDHLVKITLQAGTGIGTQWGYFYDIKMDVLSRIFQCIFDQYNGKVAYGGLNRVIVRDIFDKTKYYLEITSFAEPFSEVAEPIKNVEFVNDGESVKITYLTGSDYQKTTEIFDLF